MSKPTTPGRRQVGAMCGSGGGNLSFTPGFVEGHQPTWRQFLRWLRRYVEATLVKTNSPIFSVGALRLLLDYALQNGIDADLEALNKLYYSLLLPLAREGYIQLIGIDGGRPGGLLASVVNVDARVVGHG